MGVKRNIYLTTPHFLAVPHPIDAHSDLIATVPLELGTVFSRLGTVMIVPPPVPLPLFALRVNAARNFPRRIEVKIPTLCNR